MFKLLRRRRMSEETRRKLLLFQARAEESIIELHVENIMDLLRTMGSEMDLEQAITAYSEMIGLEEDLGRTVATRVLALVGKRMR